jgi:hypothetical protein
MFASTGKPGSVESLFGPLGELLNAMVDFVWWSIWAKGFACGVMVVLIPLVIILSAVVLADLLERRRTGQ